MLSTVNMVYSSNSLSFPEATIHFPTFPSPICGTASCVSSSSRRAPGTDDGHVFHEPVFFVMDLHRDQCLPIAVPSHRHTPAAHATHVYVTNKGIRS